MAFSVSVSVVKSVSSMPPSAWHPHSYSSRIQFTPHSIEDILGRGRKRGREEKSPLNLVVDKEEEVEETGGRRKKMRTTFTGRQIFELEKMFESRKYLNANERSHLSR